VNIERDVPLAPHTSLRVGGPADWFLLAHTANDAAAGLNWAIGRDLPVAVIGGGSNLLVADAGVEGLVIKTAFARSSIDERDDGLVVVADAGANLANLARKLAKQDIGGLEWAANVPGTVGGAVVNNAGAFDGDIASTLLATTGVNAGGARTRLTVEELRYAYRTSDLKRGEFGDVAVESAELKLTRRANGEASARVKEFNAHRMRTQPRTLSAGSVFANPAGHHSGKLIEDAGLKGAAAGSAQISELHANFIVNPGGATARDVYTLMRRAQDAVFEGRDIWLRAEIELFGRWSEAERMAIAGPLVMTG